MHALSVGDCLRFGWETFKKRPWILIGGFLLVMIISALPGILGPHPEIGPDGQLIPHTPTAFELAMSFTSLLVSIFAGIGLTTFALRAHDNIETVQISDLWNPGPFWRFLGAHILSLLIITAGILLLIVPGIIAAIGLGFVAFLVIDRGAGPVEALKESWRITKGHKWKLALLGLALVGVNILGVLALGIGVLVSAPISLVAGAHAYRTLAG
jgi:uncharacterized membrane protein